MLATLVLAEPLAIGSAESEEAAKIGAGKAFLKVTAYPWDVEFEVCDREERSL